MHAVVALEFIFIHLGHCVIANFNVVLFENFLPEYTDVVTGLHRDGSFVIDEAVSDLVREVEEVDCNVTRGDRDHQSVHRVKCD